MNDGKNTEFHSDEETSLLNKVTELISATPVIMLMSLQHNVI